MSTFNARNFSLFLLLLFSLLLLLLALFFATIAFNVVAMFLALYLVSKQQIDLVCTQWHGMDIYINIVRFLLLYYNVDALNAIILLYMVSMSCLFKCVYGTLIDMPFAFCHLMMANFIHNAHTHTSLYMCRLCNCNCCHFCATFIGCRVVRRRGVGRRLLWWILMMVEVDICN